ncbi:hypothetical protein Egran_01096 [Elaphomyces granulatus]|uniref:Inhibitor I9 domain-containing protein n=1 Tax=Elaphomyces granulatus TaxID=519963 RepID=A0A232M4Z9_9EURO|nr:hypothetical protein Egran_01096 [Elaphomyces granulatus]
MKLLSSILLFGLLMPFAGAAQSYKSFIVTYPQDTPDSLLCLVKEAITKAGGIITHEYHLIKYSILTTSAQFFELEVLIHNIRGFAAKASADAVETILTLSAEYTPLIEEDKVVSINGDLVD